jgi:serine/threonine-protein kinase
MSPIVAKGLRLLGWAVYAGVLMVCLIATAYASFNLFVRSGGTSTPALGSLSLADAERVLSDQGLTLRRSESTDRFDAEVATGHVVWQSPSPRTLVKRGSAVEVALSLGPERITVPDLDGTAVQVAQVTLASEGLTSGRLVQVLTEGESGRVVGQSPQAGTLMPPSGPVDLLVDSGEIRTYIMPELVYRRYDEIRSFFERRGFRFGSIKFERYEGLAEGTILRQFPLAGHPLSPRDAISLVVAAPAEEGSAPTQDLAGAG